METPPSFRPLSWGLSFNALKRVAFAKLKRKFSSPFLGTFFQYAQTVRRYHGVVSTEFSSPFLGTFFQLSVTVNTWLAPRRFRPLSWGLSFNRCYYGKINGIHGEVFVPFLGDFLSINRLYTIQRKMESVFVPFLGDFLSIRSIAISKMAEIVFVPFLGDFLSILRELFPLPNFQNVFVPFLGDFLSICVSKVTADKPIKFSSPFLGTFFQLKRASTRRSAQKEIVFVPFLGDFLSIACLRSPSPSALASAFAAGMRGSLHQALSIGDEMPIFPGMAGIGGDLQ